MALKNDGTVVSWGDNEFGQCNVPSDEGEEEYSIVTKIFCKVTNPIFLIGENLFCFYSAIENYTPGRIEDPTYTINFNTVKFEDKIINCIIGKNEYICLFDNSTITSNDISLYEFIFENIEVENNNF
jgi:hypothetical protein